MFSVSVNDKYRIKFTLKETWKSHFLPFVILLNFQTTIIDMITVANIDPAMIANNLTPFEPTHPGELIRDELKARNLSQAKLANQIGISPSLLNEVINGKRAVNTELAWSLVPRQ
jgi:hypothetical protein